MKSTIINETRKLNYAVKEAFNTLRTNFLFSGSDVKTVLVTSCVKNEGKSTVSIELAKALALYDKKVLLIDSDLRKSVFASEYTTNSGDVVGLSEYLSGQVTYDDVLYSTQQENLDMIFAGAVPPNPVELLGSKKFEQLVKGARENYDYVIVDAAPLGAVIDASVISSFCDGAVLIITANEISYRFAQDIKSQIEKSGCKILGAVLNRIPLKSTSYYNNYYKKYYGKYGRYGGRIGSGGDYNYGGYGYDTAPEISSKGEEATTDKMPSNEVVEEISTVEIQEEATVQATQEASVNEEAPRKSYPVPQKSKNYPLPKAKKNKKKK